MYSVRPNKNYVQQQQPYSGQAVGPNVGVSQMPGRPNVGVSQMPGTLPSGHAAMMSGHTSSATHVYGSMVPTSALQAPGQKVEPSDYPQGDRHQYGERTGALQARFAASVPYGHHQHQTDIHERLDVASGLRKELPQAQTLQSASIEETSWMYPSRGNIVYGQQGQQPYSGQSNYDQNLGPDGVAMPSRHAAAILSGHPSSSAHYGGLQVYGASGNVPGPFSLEGQNGYGPTMQESSKYASGDYFERPSVYRVLDPPIQPTDVFADSLTLRSILEKDKLNETNFFDWYRNLRIVLKYEGKLYVLDARVPHRPDQNASRAVKTAYEKHFNDSIDVGCLMLNTMSPELQKDLERLQPYEMIVTLRKMFQHQTRQERFETTKAMCSCKMAEGSSVSPHFLKMNSYLERLSWLGFPVPQDLAIDLLLSSLPKSYDEFVKNYTMNNNEESFSELHSMLKTAEKSIVAKPNPILIVRKEKVINTQGKPNHVLMVRKGKAAKVPGKGKKIIGKPKPKPNAKPQLESQPKVVVKGKTSQEEAICFHCNGVGHWKRNCKLYLEELKQNKANVADT